MDKEVMDHQKRLEVLEYEDKEEDRKLSIAEKKAIESELRAKYGTLAKAKQVLGFIKIDHDTLHSLYSTDPSLRELHNPRNLRRLG